MTESSRLGPYLSRLNNFLTITIAWTNLSLMHGGNMNKRNQFTIFLILLLVLSTFVAVFHHHENTADDHDCPICVASHHLPASSQPTVASVSIPYFTETIYVSPVTAITEKLFISFLNNRAPPA
jgi:hypothetical protein